MQKTDPTSWEHPSLVQLWGPRFNVFVVAERDRGVFSLARLPEEPKARQRAEELAARLKEFLGENRMSYEEAGNALGVHPNSLRYAAATGTLLMRWEGARRPIVWIVPAPDIEPSEARRELARRYLHVYGPTTSAALERWAGIGRREAVAAFDALQGSLTPVATPIGDAWILDKDEDAFRAPLAPAAPARLLPSGDPYLLLHGSDRELMLPDAARRSALWTPRVWPGGLLVGGELVGTWRRADATLTIQPWQQLTPAQRDAVVAEAESLPVSGIGGRLALRWEGSP